MPVPSGAESARILGIAWSLFGETADSLTVLDHQSDPATLLTARLEVTFMLNGAPVTGTLSNDAFSLVGTVFVNPTDVIQYQVQFVLDGSDINSLIVSAPVLDDVTIFYSYGARILQQRIEP